MTNLIYVIFTFFCFSFMILLHGQSSVHEGSLQLNQLTSPIFNIQEHGAVDDGLTLNTHVFEVLVRRVAQNGKGTIYVPRGRFLTAPFNVTSNLTLYLDEGAVILASTNETDWPLLPPLPSYGQGRDHVGPRYTSLIHGEWVSNVVITGKNGTIDGQGARWWKAYQDNTELHTRGSLIEFLFSHRISISNITLLNSPFWNIHPYFSSKILIQNVAILAPSDSPNTDGVVPDSSSNVVIENSYIATGDDAIAIKSGWDCYGVWSNQPSSHIYIRHITVYTPNGIGLAIGSEMSGGVEYVWMEDSVFIDVKEGLRIKSNQDRSGYVRHISHKNITIFKAKTGIMIDLLYRDRNPSCADVNQTFPLPIIENLSYVSIHGKETLMPGKLHGLSNLPIKNFQLEDVIWDQFNQTYECSNAFGSSQNVYPPITCMNDFTSEKNIKTNVI